MNYIKRNHKFNIDDNKAFEIYSDYTLNNIEYSCDYYKMIDIMQDNIDELINEGLINYHEAWNMRNDYILYNETVELLEFEEVEED